MDVFQIKERRLVIRMPKELDHFNAESMRRETDRLILERNINCVEFDFRDTDFMDSSGVGVIMGRYQNLRLLGGRIVASHVGERIYRILHLSGAEKLIEVERERTWNQDDRE